MLGNGYSGMRQSHCVAWKWTKYRVLFNALSRISWLLIIAQIKQSTGDFSHHYYCTFSFMTGIWAEPVYTLMLEKTTFPANGTVVIELPGTSPFVWAVSWRMAHGVESWFLCTSVPLVILCLHSFRTCRMIWLARDWTLKLQRQI